MMSDVASSAEIICVGDELLTGDTIDTNSAEIGQFLRCRGFVIQRAVLVPDTPEAIARALAEADGADLCILTGGLGPTLDDLTAAGVARAAGVPCEQPPAAVAAVTAALAARGREPTPHQLRQADFPEGAVMIPNPRGIAPGFALEWRRRVSRQPRLVIALPGVPAEMRAMLGDGVAALLAARWPGSTPQPRRRLRCFGLPEAVVASRSEAVISEFGGFGEFSELSELGRQSPKLAGLTLHYCARGPEVDLTLGVAGITSAAADRLELELRRALGDACYAVGEIPLAARLVAILRHHGLTLATAESCTGGRVAAALTAVAGASACFHGGIVAYDNAIKTSLLGIPAAVIAAEGAVSEAVARGMASGVREALTGHADLGVGITGIAGPGGGSPTKPVGTVDIAVADPAGTTYRRLLLRGERPAIQEAATQWALWLVFSRLRERGLSEVGLVD